MGIVRDLARRAFRARTRRLLREVARELPVRAVDFVPDAAERLRGGKMPRLPPPPLRRSVGRSSSRREYLAVGSRAAAEIVRAVRDAAPGCDQAAWLDFGCGSRRVARHIPRLAGARLTGVNIDVEALAWSARHLEGRFLAIDRFPPLPFAAESFDAIYAVSVFSHFDEDAQIAWLAELPRLLRRGGVLVASTHGEGLRYSRPDLTYEQHVALNNGFLFAPGSGRFNDDSAFHTRAYLERVWGECFDLVLFREQGLAGYQDLSVWRVKRDSPPAAVGISVTIHP